MANDYFQFKQFLIKQDRTAFKVGTDGVLLGAWVQCRGAERVLDVGTGTGLLALMLAQRSDAEITAIEVDLPSCRQAGENFRVSPWSGRINVLNVSLQHFAGLTGDKHSQPEPEIRGPEIRTPEIPNPDIRNTGNCNESGLDRSRYDLIVSNPPFFSNACLPHGHARRVSRHTDELSQGELLEGVMRLLSPEGSFALILPADQAGHFADMAEDRGLHLNRMTRVVPKPGKRPIRSLMQFRQHQGATTEVSALVIEEGGRHRYSDEYRSLTRDFYLDF